MTVVLVHMLIKRNEFSSAFHSRSTFEAWSYVSFRLICCKHGDLWPWSSQTNCFLKCDTPLRFILSPAWSLGPLFIILFISIIDTLQEFLIERERERERESAPWPFSRGGNSKISEMHWHNLILQKHYANFNQSLHKASFGGWDSSLIKWRATPFKWLKYFQYDKRNQINQSFFKGEIIMK